LHSIVQNPNPLEAYFPPATWLKAAKDKLPEIVEGDSIFQEYYTKNALRARSTKLVMDPANPTNNVADRVNASAYGWQMLKKACDPSVALKVKFFEVYTEWLRFALYCRAYA
jgi:hypothetical protein